MARARATDSPTARAAAPSRSRGSSDLLRLAADSRKKQVGDARRAHIAECAQALGGDAVEEHDALAKCVTLVQRRETARLRDLRGVHPHLAIARFHLVDRRAQHDPAAVEE